jgi:hypothetical protein
MNRLQELFTSPDLYPLMLDVEKNVLTFLRMSPESYRNSVFLDLRAQPAEPGRLEIRMDDLLLGVAKVHPVRKRVHYILNSAFCCSTLLARYFELLPSCFVLKEPRLLSQLAVLKNETNESWKAAFDLCLRLLCRTYDPDQMVVVKPVDCCSLIGNDLLEQNQQATVTFLMTPLRGFLLAILKSGERRDWARQRIRKIFRSAAAWPSLAGVDLDHLNVTESAACLWLVHRYLAKELTSGAHRSRVQILNGDDVVESPRQAVAAIATLSDLKLEGVRLDWMLTHPSVAKYSKDLSRPYDANSRCQETAELEKCWAAEADKGIEWAKRYGWDGCQFLGSAPTS